MKSPLNEFTFEIRQDSFNDIGKQYEQVLVIAQHNNRKFNFAQTFKIPLTEQKDVNFKAIQKMLIEHIIDDIFEHSVVGKKVSYPTETYPYRMEIGEWNHETEQWEFDDELTITL